MHNSASPGEFPEPFNVTAVLLYMSVGGVGEKFEGGEGKLSRA